MEAAALLAELAGVAGGANVSAWDVSADGGRFALCADWPRVPLGVVTPQNEDETARVVRVCEAANAALVMAGGGTQLHTGYRPRQDRPYLLLSTARMNRILDYQPDDMTVTCEPGVTLDALAQTLAAHRQFLPLDVPLPASATVGGVVSTNQSGFRRAMYGMPRDLVIGIRAVLTGGAQIKGGGKVVKNVAGYDVCKLFTGGWGTVGVLTEVTFKVYPQPEQQRLLRLAAPDLDIAAQTGLALHHAQLAPASLLVTNEWDTAQFRISDPPNASCLLVLLQGPADRMDWQTMEIGRRSGEAGLAAPEVLPPAALAALRDRQARVGMDTRIAARIACLLADMPPLLAGLQNLPDLRLTADCAMGTVQAATSEPDADFLRTLLSNVPHSANLLWTRLDAASSPPAGLQDLLDGLNVWGNTRETALLQRGLKQAIDPLGTFSPGRFVGRI